MSCRKETLSKIALLAFHEPCSLKKPDWLEVTLTLQVVIKKLCLLRPLIKMQQTKSTYTSFNAGLNAEYHKNMLNWFDKNTNDSFQALGKVYHPCKNLRVPQRSSSEYDYLFTKDLQ